MTWAWHDYLGPLAVLFWLSGSAVGLRRKKMGVRLLWLGVLVTGFFIAGLWLTLGRPPLRTMGETRLWYAFFLPLAGLLAYRRWPYGWLLIFVAVMASVFTLINVFRPETRSNALMPALQSVYFVPHVTLYMLSYSLLAASAVASVIQFVKWRKKKGLENSLTDFIQNTVYVGLGLIMLGLITGAVWAKEAWGHYWSWDPKETWAFVTLATYLVYLHLSLDRGLARKTPRPELVSLILPLGFLFLMITWLGLSYLPTAPGSVHIYQ